MSRSFKLPIRLALALLISLTQVGASLTGSFAAPAAAPARQASDGLGPNNSFGSALNIEPNNSVQDSIAPVGDVDWYRFAVDSQGELQVAITTVAPELDVVFRVWNADARDLTGWIAPLAAGGDNIASVDLPEPGRYLIEVRDSSDNAESPQPYTLQTTFTPTPVAGEGNNSFGFTTPLPFDTPLQAAILPVGESDWYGITVDGHGELTVSITGVPANLEVTFRVWDSDARDLTGWINPLAAGGDNIAIVDLPSGGRYALEVRDNNDDARSVASYTIAASFTVPADTFEPNNSFGRATPLTLGSEAQANILPRGDADWYRIRVEHHGELQVTIGNVSPDLDISFRVWDGDVRDLTGWINPLAKGGDTTGVIDLPAPGEYTLEVRDGGDDGRSIQAYSLRTLFTPAVDPFEPNNSFGKATFLGINRQTQANILPRGDSDWYAFVTETQGQLDVAITSVPVDMDIVFRVWDAELRDASGWIAPLAKGGETHGTLDIGVPGEYVLEVRDSSDDARSIDPYDLSIDFIAAADKGEPNNTIDTAAAITLDQTIVGNVLPAGDADWCIFEIAEPGELHILVTNVSPDLEIAFRLWDGNKNVIGNWVTPLAAGGNTEAVFPIETAGTYYLELVDNQSSGRSIQPYYLYFSMEPIDPTVVVPAVEEPPTGETGVVPTGQGTATTSAPADSGLKIRISGQAGPQGAELFVREPEEIEVNGARLIIPPGAVDGYVTIHMGTTDQAPINAPYGMFPAGKYWVLDPDGLQFTVPITMMLPVPDGSATAEVFVGHWDGTEWTTLGGTLEDGLITVQTDSFSYFGVFCGAFEEYQAVTLRNETSSEFLTLTYLSGPQPDPAAPESSAGGCPAPYGGARRWELKTGESASLLARPGLYQIEVAYPTPQPGVANTLLFRVPPGGGAQTIAIQDTGATSDDADAGIVFSGNAVGAGTNVRPIIACNAVVPAAVPILNADPAATALPSRVVLIGMGAPMKLEHFPPNGSGLQFSATATDAEGSELSTYWTVRDASGSRTSAGSVVASGATIGDESNFTPPLVAGRYTVFLTVYDQFGLFDECRWVIDVSPNAKPQIEVFSGRVHVEFGRLDEERANVGPIAPLPATLRPGVAAPLPVAMPNGTTVVWDGLTLCPTAVAGPLTALTTLEETIIAPAPVDVMLPSAPIASNDPAAPAEDITNLWAYPGRTCAWAIIADADQDALDIQWEFPGPIFGSGTFFAATSIPAGFTPDAAEGMALGTFLRTTEQLRAYNAWSSFLYNSFGVIPAIVWEAWDDPCPDGQNPCPSAISRSGVEALVAKVTDTYVKPSLYDYTYVDVGPDAVEPNECGSVLFFSELRPNPPDPQAFQGVEVHARLSSLTQDCPVRFIINGTDGYAVDTYIPTNKDGEATIFIPGAREGIVDTIIAEVCRGPLSDLATPPPPEEQCMTQAGEPGWLLRIEVQYIF